MSIRRAALWAPAADALLGSALVSSLTRAMSARRVRILAYHGVADAELFRTQMEHVRDHYSIVSSRDIADAVHRGRQLPPHPTWVTFDDGDPTVFANALPTLRMFDIPATMFVCPAMVGTHRPYWWTIASAYERANLDDEFDASGRPVGGWVSYLKTIPDQERRLRVAEMEAVLTDKGLPPSQPQLTLDQLHQFVAAGGDIGNHTWDHPCLDRCSELDQERQIQRAHDWIVARIPNPGPLVFAYPNGNHAKHSEDVLRRLGYELAVLFDHRLADISGHPWRMSRVRTSDIATRPRFSALVSGSHPLFQTARTRVRKMVRP